jgi:chromate transporter
LFRDEFVRRRGWIADAEFLDMVGAANLIPGPTSTEVAMHLGHRRGGWPGLLVAGVAFILPAAILVAALAAIYVTFGTRPEIQAVLTTVAPVVIAIIAHAGWSLGRAAVRGPLTAGIVSATVGASLAGVSELFLIVAMGLLALLIHGGRRTLARIGPGDGLAAAALVVPGSTPVPGEGSRDALAAAAAVAGGILAVGGAGPGALAILGAFLKIGALLFGSGYVLVAFLRTELVEGLGWLTEPQLLDAIAVGQATPGPYYTTATFVGYVVGGPVGAGAATVGIFLPGFVAVALSIPLLHRIRRWSAARAFLDGVNAAAVGLLAVVTVRLAAGIVPDPVVVLLGVGAFLLLLRGVGAGWLVGAAALLGLARLVLAGPWLGASG